MTNVPYPGCYCADCVEGIPSARITGDKDRENPVEGAPTNRWLASNDGEIDEYSPSYAVSQVLHEFARKTIKPAAQANGVELYR